MDTRSCTFIISGVTYQDSACPNSCVVFCDAATGKGNHETLIIENCQFDGVNGILGGDQPKIQYLPAVPIGATNMAINTGGQNVVIDMSSGVHIQNEQSPRVVLSSRFQKQANNRFEMDQNGKMNWGIGTSAADTNLYRGAANVLKSDDKIVAKAGLGAGNTVAHRKTPSGATARAMEIFNASGNSLGYIPIYGAKW